MGGIRKGSGRKGTPVLGGNKGRGEGHRGGILSWLGLGEGVGGRVPLSWLGAGRELEGEGGNPCPGWGRRGNWKAHGREGTPVLAGVRGGNWKGRVPLSWLG